MRTMLVITTASIVLALAIWAYRQNYSTQDALRRVDELNAQIAVERERLAILRAEWAYLIRPENLRELSAMNFDRLQLFPISHQSFGSVEQISFPDRQAAGVPARPGAEVTQ